MERRLRNNNLAAEAGTRAQQPTSGGASSNGKLRT